MKDILHDRDDKYYALFNYYLDPCIILDLQEGDILALNHAAQRFIRSEKDKLVGRKLSALLPKGSAADPAELMEQIRMFGHGVVEWDLQLGTGEVAKTQLSAACYSYSESQEILLSLRTVSSEVHSRESQAKVQQLRERMEEIKRLNYELNNPLQELISRIELHGDQRYRKPLERITKAMREVRSLDVPPPKATDTISKARTIRNDDKRIPCTKNRILIVDDDINIRNLFNNILRLGIPQATLEMAINGPGAIRAFEREHHELIIMDFNMPKMTGDRVLRTIEEFCRISYWKMPTVILCTGYDPGDTLAKLKSHDQPHSCLLKPVSCNHLLTVVQEKLGKPVASV